MAQLCYENAMAFRFLHTADLQIGKGFGRFPADVAAILREQRLASLNAVAVLARERCVDAVLVAGDCFDDIAVSDETLRRFVVALEAFKGPWILLPGNHDPAIAESPWSRLRRMASPPLPGNVIIADEPQPIVLRGDVTVLPAPLKRKRDAADLTDWFDGALTAAGSIRIGLAHGSMREFLPEASDAANPIAFDRDRRARLDYLALGDWHGTLRISQRTWYSGTHEADSFRDNAPGFVLEVSIDQAGAEPQVMKVPVGVYKWRRAHLTITPGGVDEVDKILELGPDMEPADLERRLFRVTLEGTVDLQTRAALDARLADLGARVRYLEETSDNLILEPTDADLDAIDGNGFIRVAMERLRARAMGASPVMGQVRAAGDAESEGASQADDARRALALLYGLHQEIG